jgi:hypothetical protein
MSEDIIKAEELTKVFNSHLTVAIIGILQSWSFLNK